MDKFIKKLFITISILTCAALSLVPLTSYAVDEATGESTGKTTDSKTTHVNVNVAGTLTLEVVKDPNIITVAPEMFETGKISARVSSNAAYSIYLNAKEIVDLTLAGRPPIIIPAASGALNTPGSVGWGIKKKITAADGTVSDAAEFSAITLTPEVFYTSPGPSSSADPTDFVVGVAAAPNQQAGTYNTIITVTASTTSSTNN